MEDPWGPVESGPVDPDLLARLRASQSTTRQAYLAGVPDEHHPDL